MGGGAGGTSGRRDQANDWGEGGLALRRVSRGVELTPRTSVGNAQVGDRSAATGQVTALSC